MAHIQRRIVRGFGQAQGEPRTYVEVRPDNFAQVDVGHDFSITRGQVAKLAWSLRDTRNCECGKVDHAHAHKRIRITLRGVNQVCQITSEERV